MKKPLNKQEFYMRFGKRRKKRTKFFNYYGPIVNNFIKKNILRRGLYFNNKYEERKKTIPYTSIKTTDQELPMNKLINILNIKKDKKINIIKKEEPKIIHITPHTLMNKLKSNINLIANSTRYMLPANKINKLN